MITSALALSQVLTAVSLHGRTSDRFLSVAADKLALEGDDREAEALLLLSRSIRKVAADIELLPCSEEQKNTLRGQISVFAPIAHFSQVHLSMKDIKGNCLSDSHLVGLTYIHMALSGFVREPELDRTSAGLADEFRTMREDILKSDIPQQLKEAVISRINQIAAALDHFAFFGSQELDRELAALTGTILLHKQEIVRSSENVGKRLLSLLAKTLGAVETANKIADQSQDSIEHAQQAYAAIASLMG